MKRSEILEAARRCVCGEREQDYGTPENNFETIGLLWGVYLRAAHPEYAKVMPINGITAKDAGTMLALLKVARIATGSSPDSFIDLAGYAACAGEIVTERRTAMSKNKKRRRPMPKTCDPNMCDHCMYLGEGDFVCDLHGLGPEETVFVMEDWEPTEHFLQCRREARHE